ncbi:3-methyl-2-oxobutanoate hydroxymethyltransferase [Methylotetracoccus oryzae]|uniref:3-methyl-2-oxobutanoate hydroxymethyltransferase n=1 Tax=Methylotetracoccus oryzae TaxID=1919059 RepID=UPI0011192113|nr:3-methyl-2-oxobutanoate hydroxymethyltransferase [Methylotetracoccus oryzae]
MSDPRVTLPGLLAMKARREKITCLTAYDATFAQAVDAAEIDMLLVGDSLGMVIQGSATTLSVTIDDVVYHTRCVASAVNRSFVLADLPFMSCPTPAEAAENAARLMRAGAHAVKIEGAGPQIQITRFLSERHVPVCGHLGLLPQAVHKLGGYRVQGRDAASAQQLLTDAEALVAAGATLLVLECIPAELAAEVTARVPVPTIGIGAGPACDGQVLVLHDMLGLTRKQPGFSRNFLDGASSIQDALVRYRDAVRAGTFPAPPEGAGHP